MEKRNENVLIKNEKNLNYFFLLLDNEQYHAKYYNNRYCFMAELFASFIASFYDPKATIYFPAIDEKGRIYSVSKSFYNDGEKFQSYCSSLLKLFDYRYLDESLGIVFKKLMNMSVENYKQLGLSTIIDIFVLNSDRHYNNVIITNKKRIISSFDYDLSFAYKYYCEEYHGFKVDDKLREIYTSLGNMRLENVKCALYRRK